jgi:ribonuclease BN (tRNA processing enzyme)
VEDGASGEAAGCRWTAREVVHVPTLECFGYRVECDDGVIAYTGDTSLCDALVPLAQGADVFVAECSCWDEGCGAIHLTPTNIRHLRKQISPSTKFILTHIGAGEAPAYLAEAGVLIADDLKTLTV